MPNTPSLIGEGATVYSLGKQCSQARDGKIIEALFAGVGRECHLVPEAHIDAVTGISGSGPAYMYMIIGKAKRNNHLFLQDLWHEVALSKYR